MTDATAPAAVSAPSPVASAAAALMADPAAASGTTPPAPAPTAPTGETPPAAATETPPGETPPEPEAIKRPGKDAAPEEWAKFYDQLGRPETPDAYELPVPEGEDGAFAKQVAPMLHKHGLTAEQAKGLATDWNAMVAEQNKQFTEADTAAQAQIATTIANDQKSLQAEWGDKYTENQEFARRAAKQFLPADKAVAAVGSLIETLGYKEATKFLHSIGKGLGEGDAAGLGQNNAGTPSRTLAQRLFDKSQ